MAAAQMSALKHESPAHDMSGQIMSAHAALSMAASSSSSSLASAASAASSVTTSASFDVIDRDGDGAIDAADLAAFFTSCLRQPLTELDAAAMVAMADFNSDGRVDLDEFNALLGSAIDAKRRTPPSGAMAQIFEALDLNGDGVLSRDDLQSAMAMAGSPLSEDEISSMMYGHGDLDFPAFAKIMQSCGVFC